MEKKKKLIVLGVIILLLVASGLTYAILTWQSGNINIGINTNCFTIDYTKGNNISGSLKLINEEDLISNGKFTIKEGVGVSSVNIGIKSTCSIEGYGNILLNITNISSVFTTGDSKGALKYAVLKNTSTITDPTQISTTSLLNQSFDIEKKGSITTSDTLKLLTKQLSNTELYKYIIVIYVDNNLAGNDVTSATFQGNISADATQGKAPLETAATRITNLYTNAIKTEVPAADSITYNYATKVGLMNDKLGSSSTDINGGNIRYYGASPNNYIYFNCDDYSNQSSSTCETWRIIGVFDGKLKIMRNEAIGNIPYDDDDEDTYLQQVSNDSNDAAVVRPLEHKLNSEVTADLLAPIVSDAGIGQNDYSKSSLQKILNNYYYNGVSYSGKRNYDFTSIGLKNEITRNMISDSVWYLRGFNISSIYASAIYNYERTAGSVVSGNETSWPGKIALAYPSDYGYAADFNQCKKQLESYNDSTCTSNNWMKAIIAPNNGWLLTPNSGNSNAVWYVNGAGYVNYVNSAYYEGRVAPVLYLGSELEIKAGDGSSSTPYQLSA